MISSFHTKRKRNCRSSYFSEEVHEYLLRMQRRGGKNRNEVMNKDWYKKGWTMDIREVNMKEKFDVVINMADGAIGYLENDMENMKIFEVVSNA